MLDLLKYNGNQLDPLTETFDSYFYLKYMSTNAEYFRVLWNTLGNIIGYCIGKDEGNNKLYHGHVSAVTIQHNYRRLGCAKQLMDDLEYISNLKKCYFVDLFVRSGNSNAIKFYEKNGYYKYRIIDKYYHDNSEDAWDLRKPMNMDKNKLSLKCKKKRIKPNEIEWNTL